MSNILQNLTRLRRMQRDAKVLQSSITSDTEVDLTTVLVGPYLVDSDFKRRIVWRWDYEVLVDGEDREFDSSDGDVVCK